MAGKNGHIHVDVKTELKEKILKEAEENNLTITDLVTRKLEIPLQDDIILILNRLYEIITEEIKNGRKKTKSFN